MCDHYGVHWRFLCRQLAQYINACLRNAFEDEYTIRGGRLRDLLVALELMESEIFRIAMQSPAYRSGPNPFREIMEQQHEPRGIEQTVVSDEEDHVARRRGAIEVSDSE